MTNNKANAGAMAAVSSFKLRHSSAIRHSSFVIRILTLAIRAYQLAVAPAQTFLFGPTGGCRFTPTCSQYALEAVHQHGAIAGGWLATKRICHCHPWGEGGHDPVPPNEFGIRPSTLRYDAAGDSPVLRSSAAAEGGESGI